MLGRPLILGTMAVALGLLGVSPTLAQDTSTGPGAFHVTPVEGPSWRTLLKVPFDQSAMGRMGMASGDASGHPPQAWGSSSILESLDKPTSLNGADLYRLNCQSCHNVGGSGSPPEIRSLVDPVRATSVAIIREQLKRRGAEVSDSAVQEMASQAKTSLLERLKNGGERMPPFRHLQPAEVDVLLSYLGDLAGLPKAPGAPKTVAEPVLRIGEEVVKGNCFICHDAVGPGSDAMASVPQLIPSLASFPEQKSVVAFVRKAREGAPVPGSVGKNGRMPVFSYLTGSELAAAYFYLAAYPPRGAALPSPSPAH
jgi:mono/diheme cytochrome c family protein